MKRFDPYEPGNPWRDEPRTCIWPWVAGAVAFIVFPVAAVWFLDVGGFW